MSLPCLTWPTYWDISHDISAEPQATIGSFTPATDAMFPNPAIDIGITAQNCGLASGVNHLQKPSLFYIVMLPLV